MVELMCGLDMSANLQRINLCDSKLVIALTIAPRLTHLDAPIFLRGTSIMTMSSVGTLYASHDFLLCDSLEVSATCLCDKVVCVPLGRTARQKK